jgi:hypothetical protein
MWSARFRSLTRVAFGPSSGEFNLCWNLEPNRTAILALFCLVVTNFKDPSRNLDITR